MKKILLFSSIIFSFFLILNSCSNAQKVRNIQDFCRDWKFNLGDVSNAQDTSFNDTGWRLLNLPHDWSIEGEFSDKNPASPGGGALPGGIGWYRKTFTIAETDKNKLVYIDFEGVYRNSEVWINGHYLGKRPYGYSSFRYELTPYLNYGDKKNLIAVKVDNSMQPNSRWYSGSGIYRKVWLVSTDKIAVDHWGTCIATPEVSEKSAKVSMKTIIRNRSDKDQLVTLTTIICNANNGKVAKVSSKITIPKDSVSEIKQELTVNNPILWYDDKPYLYKAISHVECDGKICDDYETPLGIRSFFFDKDKGFFLNGKPLKIRGVCDHHDLGCLGAAINTRALERQLEILKDMGCNGIRTSHNPPAPELLDLADKMGFIVMDEAFDMWKKGKTEFDYHLDWDQWHKRDIDDMVLRDRNHPSVFIWSIGNEVIEQWDRQDSSGTVIAKELTALIKDIDTTRPITANCNDPNPLNPVIRSGVLDLIGFSYSQNEYQLFPKIYPGKKLIGSETTSALETRGHYDMPSDSIHRWPIRWDLPLSTGNPDFTCSSYDNCSTPWGSTHEETWKLVKKYDFVSGMFIWTGFDYLGEPTPYVWPARSSYFGILDLAGLPKDVFYLYQGEWTNKPVLHIFPHWNWKQGDTIDVWAYTNYDETELFLNGKSLGTKKKIGDELHLQWKVPYEPGVLKGIARSKGKDDLVEEVKTADVPFKILVNPDRKEIKADGVDLSFITVKVIDKNGVVVPNTDNLIKFKTDGEGFIAGVDNGDPVSHLSLKGNEMKAFHGLCLAVIQSNGKSGKITLTASSEGLEPATVEIEAK
jgi:beta-galactosidase